MPTVAPLWSSDHPITHRRRHCLPRMRFAAGMVPLVLALAACAAPLAAGDRAGQAAPSASAQSGPAGQSSQSGQTRGVQPVAPTATVPHPVLALTPIASLGDPIVTPLPPTVTPIVPPFPTLTLGPRARLDPVSRRP